MEHQLEIQNLNGIQVVDSRIIAKGLDIQHQTLIDTIRKYQERLEKLGILRFETEVLGKGQPLRKTYTNLYI